MVKTFYWTHIKWTFNIYIQYLQLIFSEKCIRAIQSCISLLGSDQERILFLPWNIFVKSAFIENQGSSGTMNSFLLLYSNSKNEMNEIQSYWQFTSSVLLTTYKTYFGWNEISYYINNSYMHVWNSLPISLLKKPKTKQKIKIQ